MQGGKTQPGRNAAFPRNLRRGKNRLFPRANLVKLAPDESANNVFAHKRLNINGLQPISRAGHTAVPDTDCRLIIHNCVPA